MTGVCLLEAARDEHNNVNSTLDHTCVHRYKRVSASLVELGSSSPPVCLASQEIREQVCDDSLLWDPFAEFAHHSSESIVPRRIDFSFGEVFSSALHERHGLLV